MRLAIRPKVYRGKAGFSLSGSGYRIFAETRAEAEYIRDQIKAGNRDWRFGDYLKAQPVRMVRMSPETVAYWEQLRARLGRPVAA